MLNVTLIPILDDNYAYVLQSGEDVAVLDPGEATPVIEHLEINSLKPSIIFNTHHHGDHIAGNSDIKDKYSCKIWAPEKDKHRISDIDKELAEGDELKFGDESFTVMETPGHTSGHICLWFSDSRILFSGDTLFAMGCGRIFEGTSEQLFNAFERFKRFPDDTKVYCGHEYTLSNGEFCLSIEPDNIDLQHRMIEAIELRKTGKPTIPTKIGLEKKTNVFMRAKTSEEFKKYRDLKDNF